MKTLHALLGTIILLYLVGHGNCSAIDAKTEAWGEEEVAFKARAGIFDKLFGTLINGYETATQILHELLEKDGDKGLLSNMYEKLKEELKKLKDYILGSKPAIDEEIDAARRAVDRLIEEHKRIHANSKMILEGALESAKNARLVRKIVNEGPDVVRHRIYEIDRALKEHVFDGVTKSVDLAKNDVNYAVESFRTSVDFLEEQGIKLTDVEKDVLDGISKRVRESLTHAKEKVDQQ